MKSPWIIRFGNQIPATETPEQRTLREDASRARLEADYLRTHPPQVDRIQGCCDRADQGE